MNKQITFNESLEAAELEFKEEPMDKNYSNLIAGYPSRLRVKKILKELGDIGDINGKKILDVGCEAGYVSIKLLEKGADVTSIDIVESALNKFRRKLKKTIFKPKLINAALQNLPFKNNKFDAVICTETLEHAPNLKKCIYELHRVTKSGGIIIITVPIEKNRKWLYPIAKALGINTSVEDQVTLFDISIEDILKHITKIRYKLLITYSFPQIFPLTQMVVWTK